MGLDSVYLLMEFEKYFKLEIPQDQAEKIYTVQDMVDCISDHLNVTEQDSKIVETVLEQLHEFNSEIHKDYSKQKIGDHLNLEDAEVLQSLESELKLTIPRPYVHTYSIIKSIFHFAKWTPQYKWQDLTVIQFANAICALNFRELLNSGVITNTSDIYIAISGITCENLGVDIYEVQPEKKFVDDFGID